MKTFNIAGITSQEIALTTIEQGENYFVIGVEEDEYSDVFLLEELGFTVRLLAVVQNPKYLGYVGHRLQPAIVKLN